jgi:hypothetical protein
MANRFGDASEQFRVSEICPQMLDKTRYVLTPGRILDASGWVVSCFSCFC